MGKGIRNVSLVREQSSPAIYLIVGTTKFWIMDPAEFDALGFDWSKVHVVDNGSLSAFTEQRLHAAPAIRPSDVFFYPCDGVVSQNCTDYHDQPPWFGTFYSNCKPSVCIVRKDVLVAGWLSDPGGPYVNYSDPVKAIEDIHYNLFLDADFLDRMYGVGGLSTALSNAVWPGNIEGSPAPTSLPFATDPPLTPGGPKGASFNSWILPCNSNDLHPELNAWHVNDTNAPAMFTVHCRGRGPHPAFWGQFALSTPDNDAWFPFNPLDPEAAGYNLRQGSYVVMRGTLWQENNHSGCGPNSPGGLPPTTGHDGIAEMHPPDWIVRVRPPNPNARLTTARVALASPQLSADFSITPDFTPSSPTRNLQVRSVRNPVDPNFTSPGSIVTVEHQVAGDHVHVVVQPTGTFTALYHIWQISGVWSPWAGLGGGITALATAINRDGRLEVFAIGTDGALNHIWQASAGGGGAAGLVSAASSPSWRPP